ncbi:TPA: hypothetical protein N0F65_012308 [Lagenidium giganteum]|uniref:Uncharacterized protein n=1 Tax=Lagenidium giganteum TaxID=4803 RepID=A0AAV2YHA3_9STRA|nr:TPA: hypothetical protein N0F65_012308 [Lagenidium giganteum]
MADLVPELALALALALVPDHRSRSRAARAIHSFPAGAEVTCIHERCKLSRHALEEPTDNLILCAWNRVLASKPRAHDHLVQRVEVAPTATSARLPSHVMLSLLLQSHASFTDAALVEDGVEQVNHSVVRPEDRITWRSQGLHDAAKIAGFTEVIRWLGADTDACCLGTVDGKVPLAAVLEAAESLENCGAVEHASALEEPTDNLILCAWNRVLASKPRAHDHLVQRVEVAPTATSARLPSHVMLSLLLQSHASFTDAALVEDGVEQVNHSVVRPEDRITWRSQGLHDAAKVGVDVVVPSVFNGVGHFPNIG